MVISLCCGKGGTGKTTSTYNIGAALAQKGKKVLLIDNDQQGSLTLAMGYEVSVLPATLANLMFQAIDMPEMLAQSVNQENQDVQTTMILFDRTPKKKVMHYTKPTEEIRFETPLDVYIKLTYNDIDAKKFCSNDSVSMNFCNIYGEKSEWQNIIGMSDDVA